MKVKRIDGFLLEKMLRNGLNNLRQNETKINEMNVFPVPDGDTGSNMRMTLENGLRSAMPNRHLGEYAVSLSNGMLMGARGNSGVILSQIVKGFSESLRKCSIIDAKEFTEGFINGYKCAYNVVIKPVEGTILTVAREGIEHIRGQITRGMYIDSFFGIYLAELRKSLQYTPNLLACLKEANVLDSGGAGYILIIEGMHKYLLDEVIEYDGAAEESKEENSVSVDSFNELSNFDYGYCMEFILQLMQSKFNVATFNQKLFINELQGLGESLVVVKDGTRVKVHIHTKAPARIITYAQTYGEFVSFKLENMALQHSSLTSSKEEKLEYTDLVKIGIVNGEELKEIYKELGCHIVLDGGKTMNTSSEEIIRAIKRCDCQKIVIFTNNKNIELACNQAINVLGCDNVYMIRSKNSLEGYYALAMDEADNDNLDYRIKQMEAGANAIKTFTLFNASRDCNLNGVDVKKGRIVSATSDLVLTSGNDIYDIIKTSLGKIDDISEKSMCIILKGKHFGYNTDAIEKAISEVNPNIEVNYMDGGMEIYDAIIGLV